MDGNPPSLQFISFLFPQVLARRAKYIAWTLLLVAQSSNAERLGLWWSTDAQLGRRQPRAGFAGRLSRATASLCPTSTVVNILFLPCLHGPAGFLGVTCRVNSRSISRIPLTFRAAVRPASRNLPPCLLVHDVPSSFQVEQELHPIAFLCLLSVEPELIQLCANAVLFLLVLVEQGF